MREGIRKDAPRGDDYAWIMETMLQRWDKARWQLCGDFMERSHFERVVRSLDWTSSPGYPYLFQATTNRDFFQVGDDGEPTEFALDRAWTLVQQRLVTRDCDPIRLFIKPEPHKERKLERGAYRLISSVSVVDQIIDAMLFSEMNDVMAKNFLHVPGKIGWAPICGGWRIIPVHGQRALDKSAWDWSVNGWIPQMLLDLRYHLMEPTERAEEWLELARWRYAALYQNPVFITSGGLLLRQREPGVMKSGCINTISDNSLAQDLLHVRVCKQLDLEDGALIAMGDDTLQDDFPEFESYEHALSAYCHVKSSVKKSEFAGYHFKTSSVEPLYRGKHAFNMLHLDDKYGQEVANSYCLNYHRSAYRGRIRAIFRSLGYKVPLLVSCDSVFDGRS